MSRLQLTAVAVLALFLTGCASTGGKPNRLACAAAGALVGGAGTAIADGDEGAAAAGAAFGALLGALACGPEDPEPLPEPEPEPMPEPAPEPDSDGDGVIDRYDDCPGTPRGTPVDSAGCPEIPNLLGVNFEYNKAALTDEGRDILDEAAMVIDKHPNIRVEIVGHTDSRGSESYNQRLSERRAQSVVDYLTGKGISSSRLSASGRGESEPIANNESDKGRALNRRVELTARPR